MSAFKSEYGDKKGKEVAYATMTKLAKQKKLADGGQVIGGPLKELKSTRPNPYTGNVPSADDIEGASEGKNFANGGPVDKKKSAVLAIVAKLAKKPMGGMEGGEEGEVEEVQEPMAVDESAMHEAAIAAASDIIDAVKSGDKEALANALYNLMETYKAHEEGETPEEEMAEHEE
jgi:hypothetical protein